MNTPCWEDRFLSWFTSLGIPTLERRHQIGAFSYHYFESEFTLADGRSCSSHGRSQDRRLAAIKAIGECVERKVMAEFFVEDPAADAFHKSFRTSNGWAVHQSQDAAEKAAVSEALERHLLLRAYCAFGWGGFRLIQKIDAEDMEIYFLQGRLVAGELVAGLVAAKSKLYPGVSFGYCVGSIQNIQTMQLWESALFEAVDKIIALKGAKIDLSADPDSWLLAEVKNYLETPFDVNLFSQTSGDLIEAPIPSPNVTHFDLTAKWNLDFPLHAAFAYGGGLIPLFPARRLSPHETEFLLKVLLENGIDKIPERHPVL